MWQYQPNNNHLLSPKHNSPDGQWPESSLPPASSLDGRQWPQPFSPSGLSSCWTYCTSPDGTMQSWGRARTPHPKKRLTEMKLKMNRGRIPPTFPPGSSASAWFSPSWLSPPAGLRSLCRTWGPRRRGWWWRPPQFHRSRRGWRAISRLSELHFRRRLQPKFGPWGSAGLQGAMRRLGSGSWWLIRQCRWSWACRWEGRRWGIKGRLSWGGIGPHLLELASSIHSPYAWWSDWFGAFDTVSSLSCCWCCSESEPPSSGHLGESGRLLPISWKTKNQSRFVTNLGHNPISQTPKLNNLSKATKFWLFFKIQKLM